MGGNLAVQEYNEICSGIEKNFFYKIGDDQLVINKDKTNQGYEPITADNQYHDAMKKATMTKDESRDVALVGTQDYWCHCKHQ